jgi:hypothetical protein
LSLCHAWAYFAGLNISIYMFHFAQSKYLTTSFDILFLNIYFFLFDCSWLVLNAIVVVQPWQRILKLFLVFDFFFRNKKNVWNLDSDLILLLLIVFCFFFLAKVLLNDLHQGFQVPLTLYEMTFFDVIIRECATRIVELKSEINKMHLISCGHHHHHGTRSRM